MILEINNSVCKLSGVPPATRNLLAEVLTYENDIESELKNCYWKIKQCKFFSRSNKPEERERAKKTTEEMYARINKLKETKVVCLYQNDTFPTGLLNLAYEALKATNATYTTNDLRERPTPSCILRWQNKPWEPRYYQKEMIELGVQAGRGVFVSAVGTGKSLVMAYLIKELPVTSLIIVPSKGLSSQLYSDFCSWFGSQNVQVVDAEKVRKLGRPKPITIITVQSLASLNRSGEFQEFAQKIEAIYCDEIHHAGADSYTDLLPHLDHVYHRFGFTGTFLRNDAKILEMWSFLSNVLYEYPAWKAIAEGFLTPMKCVIHQMTGHPKMKYQTEYDKHYGANAELHNKIRTIIQNAKPTDQILILVSKKDKCGLLIHEYLNLIGMSNAYVSGDDKKDRVNSILADFNDKKIKILIGSSVLGEGIDIRSTDHLLMCQGGKSEVTMVQASGRLVRLYDGKLIGYLHDFQFMGSNYMEKHLVDRIDAYDRNFQCDFELVR